MSGYAGDRTLISRSTQCPARYLYATGTGHGDMKTLIRC